MLELNFILKVYDPQKMTSVSGALEELFAKKVNIGGTQVGVSNEGCFVISQPVLRSPSFTLKEGVNGFYLKIICKDEEIAFTYFSRLAKKLPPHEAALEIV